MVRLFTFKGGSHLYMSFELYSLSRFRLDKVNNILELIPYANGIMKDANQ
jgi:hypothetical protein